MRAQRHIEAGQVVLCFPHPESLARDAGHDQIADVVRRQDDLRRAQQVLEQQRQIDHSPLPAVVCLAVIPWSAVRTSRTSCAISPELAASTSASPARAGSGRS